MNKTNLLALFYPPLDDVRRQIVRNDFLLIGDRPGRTSADKTYVWAKEGFLGLSGGRGHAGVCGGVGVTATSESGVCVHIDHNSIFAVLSHCCSDSRGVCICSSKKLGLSESSGSIPCTELTGV